MSVGYLIDKRTFPKVNLAKCEHGLKPSRDVWKRTEISNEIIPHTNIYFSELIFLNLCVLLFVWVFFPNSPSWPREEQGQRAEHPWPNGFIEMCCGQRQH